MAGYAPVSPDLSAYHSEDPTPPVPPLGAPAQSFYPPQHQQQNYPPQGGYGPTLHPPQPINHFPISPQPAFHQPPMLPQQQPPQPAYQPLKPRRDPSSADSDYIPTPTTPHAAAGESSKAGRPRKPRGPKAGGDPSTPLAAAPPTSSFPPPADPSSLKPYPGQLENITVHTKFPVARIKRIMQADEDVGKVAQVTPTAVSKALELFMISLVTKAAEQAKGKGAKKVSAGHLKAAVMADEQFDFLEGIVGRVAVEDPGKEKEKGGEREKEREREVKGGGSEEEVGDFGLGVPGGVIEPVKRKRGAARGTEEGAKTRGRKKREEEMDEDD